MKPISALSLIAALAVSASTACADGGLLQSLPKDGAWTKYYMDMKQTGQAKVEATGAMTIKSVGKTVEKGKKCRWIEIEVQTKQNGKKRHAVTKLLVTEAGLKPGSKKPPEVIRGWRRTESKGDVRELKSMQNVPTDELTILFGGHRKDVKKLKDAKVIDFQKGKLKITDGTTAKLDIKPARKPPQGITLKTDVTQSLWPHKSVPFGTAAMRLHILVDVNGNRVADMKMTLTLQDYGTGAKSALPDKK